MRLVINLFGGLLAIGWGVLALDYANGARQARTLDTEPPVGIRPVDSELKSTLSFTF